MADEKTDFNLQGQQIEKQTIIGRVSGGIGHVGDVIKGEQVNIRHDYVAKRTVTKRQAVHPPATYVHRIEVEEKVRELLQTASDSAARVFLTGLPRSGVSTTAQSIAVQLEAAFADGTLWGDTQEDSYEEILWRFIEPYDQTIERASLGSTAQMRDTLAGLLRDKRVLIVLDHVQTMADVEALVPDDCPQVAALIVSRTAVPGTVGLENWVQLPELGEDEAIQLFRNVWQGNTALESVGDATLLELAELHHFMPADMMIAAHDILTTQVAPREYLADMRLRQREPGVGQAAYRPVFGALYDRLPQPARDFLPYVGVLGSRWDLDAGTAVSPYKRHTVEVAIRQLQSRFLIGEEGENWYSARPIIRDFALAKLRENGGDALVWAVQKLAAEHFLNRYQQIVQRRSQEILESFLAESSQRQAFLEALASGDRSPAATFELVREMFEEVVLRDTEKAEEFLAFLQSDTLREMKTLLTESINWIVEQEDWRLVQRYPSLGVAPLDVTLIQHGEQNFMEIRGSFGYYSNSTWQGTELVANFRALRFLNTVWQDCKFLLARFVGVEFRNSVLENVDLVGAEMPGLQVYNSVFKDVDARGADLRGAIFQDCVFENVNLLNANGLGIQFIDCIMTDVDMRTFQFS